MHRKTAERGVGLILAMLVLLLLSLLAGALMTASVLDARIGWNHQSGVQVVYAAESGIEDGRELLRAGLPAPSTTVPWIDDRPLRDPSGRETGRYRVFFTRADPPTLRSEARLGPLRRTLEARLEKSGFPRLPQAVTLAETLPPTHAIDNRLTSPAGLERLVRGIRRNATDVLKPVLGDRSLLQDVGSPVGYRVMVVDGDCELTGGAGYGLLLVRGELHVSGNFTWNGLVLVVGQGVLRVTGGSTGWIEGGLFVARTRDDTRTTQSTFGAVAPTLGPSTVDLADGRITATWSAEEWDRANAPFPYVPIGYREF